MTKVDPVTVGIISGGGTLPCLLAQSCITRSIPFHIIALKGFCDSWVKDYPHTMIGLGQIGRIFKTLKNRNCTAVLFAGHVARPKLSSLRFDLLGLRICLHMAHLLKHGDDTLLSGIAKIFEKHGFLVHSVQDYLTECLAPAGVLGSYKPSAQHFHDIERGAMIVDAISSLDIGQAVVVEHGICQALEAAPGTDVMLTHLAQTERKHKAATGTGGGVLYKAPKKNQDMRLDIPTIGPRTIEKAYQAGLSGIAVKSGQVFILELGETVSLANQYEIFLYGVEAL